jgi:hypothetical protein
VGIRYNRLTVRPIERASSTTCLILLGSIPSLSVGMPIEVVVVVVVVEVVVEVVVSNSRSSSS